MEAEKNHTRALKGISAEDVKRMFRGISVEISSTAPEGLADFIREIVERVTLDASSFEAVISLRFGPQKSGVLLASPRGFEPRLSP